MRLAMSNIAWDVHEDLAVAMLLDRFSIDAIDIAPGKYFPDPASVKDHDIVRVKQWWTDKGIEITGMQALLFGKTAKTSPALFKSWLYAFRLSSERLFQKNCASARTFGG